MGPRFGRGGRPFMERGPPPQQMNHPNHAPHPHPRMDHRGGGGGRNHMHNPRFRGGGMGGGWHDQPPQHPHNDNGGMSMNMNMKMNMGMNGDRTEDVWAETKMGDGKSYFYNTKTRITTWERPEGPGIRIIRHEDYVNNKRMMDMMNEGDGGREQMGPGNMQIHPSTKPPNMDRGPGPMVPRGQGENLLQNPHIQTGGMLQRQPGPMQQHPNMHGSPMGQGISPGNMLSGTPPGQPPMQGPQQLLGPPPSMMGPPPGMHVSGMNGPQRPGMQRGPSMLQNQAQNPFGKVEGPRMESWGQHPPFQSPFMGNSPFSIQPAGFPAPSFSVPPPWNFPGGLPTPAGVPPPADPILSQIDPKITSLAAEWSEHVAPDGKRYYYNAKTQLSTWEKPKALVDLDDARVEAQKKANPLVSQTSIGGSMSVQRTSDLKPDEKKARKAEQKKVEKCRPISSTPVPGTPWCVVWTGDRRVFFYNPATKTSVWERPSELTGRVDVDEMVRTCPDKTKVKRAEASSTTSPNDADKAKGTSTNEATQPSTKTEVAENEPPAKRTRTDSDNDVEIIENVDDKSDNKDSLKDMSAIEAEAKASKERAAIPVEIRLKQFREMLVEKEVSAFSTWEKELHKIVFDQRYLLLTSTERKKAFDCYVSEIVEEEKREKKNRFKLLKEKFFDFLTEINVPSKMNYNELSQKYGRDERFRSVEKSRDRESFFHEFIRLKTKREKDERNLKREKDREKFFEMLWDKISDAHLGWGDVKRKLENDSRYQAVDQEEREECYKQFQKRLRHKQKQGREKRNSSVDARDEGRGKSEKENGELDSSTEADKSTSKRDIDKSSSAKDTDPISEGEDEEGCVSDSDEEERVRKRRIENSIREREKQVKLSRANQLKDIDKERGFYRRAEAEQQYQALLTDLIKSSEQSWKEAKSIMKKDPRWLDCQVLQREELEDLYSQYCTKIVDKRKRLFKDMLIEHSVTCSTRWNDLLKEIRDDPRFTKFSSSERKCEREFENYLREITSTMKIDFRELLKETKLLNYKTLELLKSNPNYKKEIESHLDKDKRYLQLDHLPEERDRMLREYLLDLQSKGPPPPVTASEPSRRVQKT